MLLFSCHEKKTEYAKENHRVTDGRTNGQDLIIENASLFIK